MDNSDGDYLIDPNKETDITPAFAFGSAAVWVLLDIMKQDKYGNLENMNWLTGDFYNMKKAWGKTDSSLDICNFHPSVFRSNLSIRVTYCKLEPILTTSWARICGNIYSLT